MKRGGFPTRKAAQGALTELLADYQRGSFVPPGRVTVREYLDGWLTALPTAGRKPTTVESYTRYLTVHVLNRPAIADLGLQALGPLDLDRLYAELLRDGRRDGRGPLKNRTVRYIHGIVHIALDDATRKGLVVRNVADLASPPSAKSSKPRSTDWPLAG